MKAILRAFAATLVVLCCPAAADTVTIRLKGKLALWRDGTTLAISAHNTERDAVEAAINFGPGTYRIRQPEIEVVVAVPQVGFPACGTGRCTSSPEAIALRRHYQREATTAWLTVPANRAKAAIPEQAVLDANMAVWSPLP